MFVVKRSSHNPLIGPDQNHPWEASAAFNMCPILTKNTTTALYRATAEPADMNKPDWHLSIIASTTSRDGIHFENRKPFLTPKYAWEKYGLEDPRVTKLEDTYLITYTALSQFPFNAKGIKIAVALSPDLQKVTERHLVTPFNAKAMVIFPERIAGKITVMLSVNTDIPPTPAKIAIAQFDHVEDLWSEKLWGEWYAHLDDHAFDPRRSDSEHVEVGAPPIKTEHGWLLIYSHIQKYFTQQKIFGVEALLLDINNPKQIIGRTNGPLLIPEEIYERYGFVPNTIFPTGALVEENVLKIYYGATDTTCAMAETSFSGLIDSMMPQNTQRIVTRYEKNPIISPLTSNPWEAKATFNPAAIDLDGKIHILYRAMSEDNTSVMGYACTSDGFSITQRLNQPIYTPREEFELKGVPGGNSGCEDPRLIRLGDKIFLFYTAYNGIHAPRVAVSSILVTDFLSHTWNWATPVVISPDGVDDKDACLLPEQIKDKYLLFHRVNSHICAQYLSELKFKKGMITTCIQVLGPRPGMWDGLRIGIASPPIKTGKGWLQLYHGISADGVYRMGAVLLDLDDPTAVIARTTDPFMEPQTPYELIGQVNNVVFPCGVIVRDDTMFIYYGGADSVVGVATVSLNKLLAVLS